MYYDLNMLNERIQFLNLSHLFKWFNNNVFIFHEEIYLKTSFNSMTKVTNKSAGQGLTLTARGSTLVVKIRQILTTKVDPRAATVKLFIMAVHPSQRYSNEPERTN